MNILVLDDEKEIADLEELYLRNEDYNVYKCYGSKDAMDIVEKENIDLALLDVMVAGMSGFEICKLIREKGLNFPIIMVTAKIEDKDKITGLTLRSR